MNTAIKNAAIKHFTEDEVYRHNYLLHRDTLVSDYAVCRYIMFDLDYYEDVMDADVKEIKRAVNENLAEEMAE